MAFYLGDILVDRIQQGVFEDSSSNIKYLFTNLTEASIDITADSVDATDGTGAVIRTFYRGKTGTLTATNSVLNAGIIAAQTGEDAEFASTTTKIVMPRIANVKAGETLELPGYVAPSGQGAVAGSDIQVYAVVKNALGDKFDVDTAASATAFAVAEGTDNVYVLTPPTAANVEAYLVKYNREVATGAKISNKSDKFPKAGTLTLKLLIADPCDESVVRSAYFVAKFQPNADQSFTLGSPDTTIDLAGRFLTDYCGTEKTLYSLYIPADDEE